MSDAPAVPRGLRYGSDAEPGIRRRRLEALRVPRRAHRTAAGQAAPRTHPEAGHTARVDRRVDRGRCAQPRAGNRARRQGPQAVPLPHRLHGAPFRRQVQRAARVRQVTRRSAPAGPQGSTRLDPRSRSGRCARGSVSGSDGAPRGKRGVREDQQVVRADHAPQPARLGEGLRRSVSSSEARVPRTWT